MSEKILSDNRENAILIGIKDDVDPPRENIMATDLIMPSVAEKQTIESDNNKNSGASIENDKNLKFLKNNSIDESDGGSGGVGGGNIGVCGGNNNIRGDYNNKIDNNKKGTLSHNNMKIKRKRRRRKSKRSNNYVSYARTSWKFQGPRSSGQGNKQRLNMVTLVPYNTNKFLMEDHMPEIGIITPTSRTRDSSFSVDSDENYFYSLPEDEEEFLTKEFSSVYEDARVERLESMSKPQLIQEYLQLQANYDQLSRRYSAKIQNDDRNIETNNTMRLLEDKINQLTSENIDLRKKIDLPSSQINQDDRMDSSEDSESDSSSSSSSSSSCSSISNCGDYAMMLNSEDMSKLTNGNCIENGDSMDYKTQQQNNSLDASLSPSQQQLQIGNIVN